MLRNRFDQLLGKIFFNNNRSFFYNLFDLLYSKIIMEKSNDSMILSLKKKWTL